jgi:carboxynorspermidine decarboxylase
MWSAKEATASSLCEALLCFDEMKSLAHVYAPAYLPQEFDELMRNTSHLVFNPN